MSCISKSFEGLKKIKMMRDSYNIHEDLGARILDISKTDVTCKPYSDAPSSLFNNLVDLYKNTTAAANTAAVVYSSKFMEEYGDWINDADSCFTLDENGMPQLYFRSGNNGLCFSNPEFACFNLIQNTLNKHNVDPNISYNIAERYVGLIHALTLLNSGKLIPAELLRHIGLSELQINHIYDGAHVNKIALSDFINTQLIEWLKNYLQFGTLSEIDPIEVGFVKTSQPENVIRYSRPEYNDSDYIELIDKFIPVSVSTTSSPFAFLNNFTAKDLYLAGQNLHYPVRNATKVASDRVAMLDITNTDSGVEVYINRNTTFESLERARNLTVKDLWSTLKNIDPEYAQELRNNEKLMAFLRGVGLFIINNKGIQPEYYINAVQFGKLYQKTFSAPLYNLVFKSAVQQNPNNSQLVIDFMQANPSVYKPAPLASNQQKLSDLVSKVNGDYSIQSFLNQISNSEHPLAPLAALLQDKLPDTNVIIEKDLLKHPKSESVTCALFNPKTNSIHLSELIYLDPVTTILHESLHAATFYNIHSKYYNEANNIFSKAQKLVFDKYQVNSTQELEKKVGSRVSYGFTDADEFFSELWTNSDFIRELNSLGSPTKKSKSIVQQVIDFVLNILGINSQSEIFTEASDLLYKVINDKYNNDGSITEEELSAMQGYFDGEVFGIDSLQSFIDSILPVGTPKQLVDDVEQLASFKIQLNAELEKAASQLSNLMVQHLINPNSKTKTVLINGKAGTGKTTICPQTCIKAVEMLKDEFGQDFSAVIGVSAVSNAATTNLASKFPKLFQVSEQSVAGLLGKEVMYDEQGNEIWKDSSNPVKLKNAREHAASLNILFVDEASMLDEKTINSIEKFCPKALIIYVGDERQLRPVTDTSEINEAFKSGDSNRVKHAIQSPVFTRSHTLSFRLLERVRQGEGAPVLDLADVFGDVAATPVLVLATANRLLDTLKQKANKPINQETSTNALFSVKSVSANAVVDTFMPLILEAVETQNPYKFSIIPYHKGEQGTYEYSRHNFNNIIRAKLLKQKYNFDTTVNLADKNYVGNYPFQPGEIVMAMSRVVQAGGDSDIDNGTRLIITNSNPAHVNLAEFESLMPGISSMPIYFNEGYYIDTYGVKKTCSFYTIPERAKSTHKEILRKLAAQATQTKSWDRYFKWKSFNSSVEAAWALNIHKAQGLTYDVAYIPVDDFFIGLDEKIRRNELSLKILADFASEFYTSLTRASNITVLGKASFPAKIFTTPIQQLNANITEARKSVKREIVESVTELSPVPVEENSLKTSEPVLIIPEKYRRQYDFLHFITGNDDAYKALSTPEGLKRAQDLSLKFFLRESELVKYGRTFGQVQKDANGVYNYAELIRDPKLLDSPLTLEKINELEKVQPFKLIKDKTVKSAQVTAPSHYTDTFKLGSKSLAEINPSFFKKVNNFYRSEIDNEDLLVRTHAGQIHIAFVEDSGDALENSKFGIPLNVLFDTRHYRLDSDGKRMYALPKESALYKTSDGHEVILISKDKNKSITAAVNVILNSISDSIVSILPLLTNVDSIEDAKKLLKSAESLSTFTITEPKQVSTFTKLRNNRTITLDDLKRQLMEYYKNPEIEKIYAKKFSQTLYQSFVKACKISASRIPTQALASFMDMQIATFIPYKANEVFVSRWQMWLQGSDLDIDKSYMMGFSFGPTGLFNHWSPLMDYSSEARRIISDSLAIPNGLVIKPLVNAEDVEADDSTSESNIINVDVTNPDPELQVLVDKYLTEKDGTKAFKDLRDIIEYFDQHHSFNLPAEYLTYSEENPKGWQTRRLIYLINKHNCHKISQDATKNIAIDSIIKVCQNPVNINSAHSPIDRATSTLKKFLKGLDAGMVGDENDGMSIFQLLEDNQTGKKVVGVMANALKAFLTLTQYYNNYYKEVGNNLSANDAPFFLNQFSINGKIYSFSTLSNTTIEEQQLAVLRDALLQYTSVPQEVLRTNDDMSIILSAMVTLATDNAKELALAKLHASLNLASMHSYLVMMGVPFNEIVDYTAKSPLFTDLYNLTKADSWSNLKGTVNSQVWKALNEKVKSFTAQQRESGEGYSTEDVAQLQRLYNWAQEFRRFTLLLGVNQGFNSGIAQAIAFKITFEKLVASQCTNLNITNSLLYLTLPSFNEDLTKLIKSHGLNPTNTLKLIYKQKIEQFLTKYQNKDFYTKELEKIDMVRYFEDDEYRDYIVEAYDIFKSTINIFDVINHSPHFYEMLKSVSRTLQKAERGAKGKFLFNELSSRYNPYVMLKEVPKTMPFNINESVVKDASQYFDDFIISDALVSTIAPKLNASYTIKTNDSTQVTKYIKLDTNDGVLQFKDTFNAMVAKLRKLDPDNALLKSLIMELRANGLSIYKLNFNIDALSQNSSAEQLLKYNEIMEGLDKLTSIKLTDILPNFVVNSPSGYKNLVFGDMLYLYNLIFNLGARGLRTLTSLLDRYVEKLKNNPDSVVIDYLKTELDYDTQKKTVEVDTDNFNYHMAKRYFAHRDSIIVSGGNTFTQSELPLTNLSNVVNKVALDKLYLRFLEAYRSGLLDIDMDLNCN